MSRIGFWHMQRNLIAQFLLTAALVLVFGYFGIDKFVHPELWLGWIPLWMDNVLGLPREMWLKVIGASEAFFALLLLIPLRRVRMTGAILIALHLVAILTQVGWNDIAVRDLGLLLASLSLLFLL